MRILIGSPSADGEVEPVFARAVLNLVGWYLGHHREVDFDLEMPLGRNIGLARDILANRVLQDDRFTHLLFVDSDMGFSPELVERMLGVEKPLVGTIAPQRHRDLDGWREKLVAHEKAIVAEICAASYTPALSELDLAPQLEDDLAAKAGFLRARQTGAGILLVRRDALETMRLVCPELAETRVRPAMAAIGLVEPLVRFFAFERDRSGVLLGEDLSFTARWTERCGGELWVAPDGAITHAGTRVVTGNYQRRLALTGEL
jgi:hypothetical protein